MRKCLTCIYRTRVYVGAFGSEKNWGCAYILHTGHRRGCDPEQCDKYQRGPAKRIKDPHEWAKGDFS